MKWIAPDTCLVISMVLGEGEKAIKQPICAFLEEGFDRFISEEDWRGYRADLRRHNYKVVSADAFSGDIELGAPCLGAELMVSFNGGIAYEVWQKQPRKSRAKRG